MLAAKEGVDHWSLEKCDELLIIRIELAVSAVSVSTGQRRVRLVEQEVRGLRSLAVGLGPVGVDRTVVEVQRTAGGVFQLLVERLACDLLGHIVAFRFLDLVRAPVAPPGKLASLGLHALLDHAADGIGETIMAQAVEDHAGYG